MPEFAIIRGDASPEEVAAITAVLSASLESARVPDAAQAVRSEWSARSRLLRAPLLRGPGAWRANALPQ